MTTLTRTGQTRTEAAERVAALLTDKTRHDRHLCRASDGEYYTTPGIDWIGPDGDQWTMPHLEVPYYGDTGDNGDDPIVYGVNVYRAAWGLLAAIDTEIDGPGDDDDDDEPARVLATLWGYADLWHDAPSVSWDLPSGEKRQAKVTADWIDSTDGRRWADVVGTIHDECDWTATASDGTKLWAKPPV